MIEARQCFFLSMKCEVFLILLLLLLLLEREVLLDPLFFLSHYFTNKIVITIKCLAYM